MISLKNKNQKLNNEKIKLIDELKKERQKNKILNDNNRELEIIIKDLKLNKSLQNESKPIKGNFDSNEKMELLEELRLK